MNSSVYRETTLPINNNSKAPKFETGATKAFAAAADAAPTVDMQTKPQKPRRDKSDLGENFIAPDGGWAWLVCIAAGISNLTLYPCLQQFGFIFRERLAMLGMSSSEVTTIINTNSAVSACTGLLNGPMFRRFTFRQVAFAGSCFIFFGLILTAFCQTFGTYIVCYALLFGFGIGISVSASSLAINTYFKIKRRRAAGFAWTITGLGPIFLPYFVTFLLSVYGVEGTVIIFAAISLHGMASALIYQPVRYHAPQPENLNEPIEPLDMEYMCKFCEMQQKKETGIFSSQYLYQDDDADKPGYEIIEPGTPMMSRANDGWFGSKLSLTSGKMRFRSASSSKDLEAAGKLRMNSVISEEEVPANEEFLKPNNFSREREEAIKQSHSRGNLRFYFSRGDSLQQLHCTCAEERALLELKQLQSNAILPTDAKNNNNSTDEEISTVTISFVQKVIAFFDLDLLHDFTFVNLVAGLTIINFGELNFSILTPFILTDFGFNTSQITLAMSVLAGLDITVRFLVPFFTEKIPWDNRIFFLIGVVGIAIGRTVVACTRSYTLIFCCFVWIGMCKGVRTIFWPLIIPGCVPLKRLPAASGLQLLISGLFTLVAGPFVGLIRDRYNYSVTLHCLNMLSFIAAGSWSLEALIRRYYRRKRKAAAAAAEAQN